MKRSCIHSDCCENYLKNITFVINKGKIISVCQNPSNFPNFDFFKCIKLNDGFKIKKMEEL